MSRASVAAHIYQIKNSLTGQVYVGSAVNVKDRWAVHRSRLRNGDHHSIRLQRAWNRDGEASFDFSILEEVERVKETILAREQHWIDMLNAFGVGYNMAPMSSSSMGTKRSAETIARLSKARTGLKMKPHTEAAKEKIRRAHLGKLKGPMSDEHKAKIAAANTGRVMSESTRDKISKALTGLVRGSLTREHAEKIRQANTGIVRSERECRIISERMKGLWAAGRMSRISSEETRAKMSASHKGRKRSEETQRKISETNRLKREAGYRRASPSAETVEKRAAANRGRKNTEETKRKMSESAKRRFATQA